MIHKHSRQVYESIILPQIKARHKRVMDALNELGDATSYEIADKLNVGVHTLSGRLSELSGSAKENTYPKPMIESVGERNNKYSNPCTVWRIKVPQPVAKVQEMF